jgi:hypothetical protein
MRIKNLVGVLFVFVLIASIITLSNNVDAVDKSSELPLVLKVSAGRQTYVLGETVKLDFELQNEGETPITLPFKPNVMTGYLKVWIALNGQEFNLYNNSSWGRFEGSGVTIKPGGVVVSNATILWNNKPQIPRAGEGKILTDYALPDAGSYFIKAVLSIPDKDSPDTLIRIESKPIRITVNEPIGDDLKVWNRIKGNAEIAYFLQQADTPTYRDAKAEQLIDEVKQILEEYPNNYLATQLKQKLEKYQVDEEKRTLRLNKSKLKPNN